MGVVALGGVYVHDDHAENAHFYVVSNNNNNNNNNNNKRACN